MPLNVNSSSPGAERSRHLSVRCLRAVRLFLFSRRMVWFLAVTVSVLVLAWHYENWNGARELAAARQRMLARAGTGNPMDLLPPEVPEPDNFFAVPEIVSWREPSSNPDVAGGFVIHDIAFVCAPISEMNDTIAIGFVFFDADADPRNDCGFPAREGSRLRNIVGGFDLNG